MVMVTKAQSSSDEATEQPYDVCPLSRCFLKQGDCMDSQTYVMEQLVNKEKEGF